MIRVMRVTGEDAQTGELVALDCLSVTVVQTDAGAYLCCTGVLCNGGRGRPRRSYRVLDGNTVSARLETVEVELD